MDHKMLLELAVETLERQKSGVDAEIEAIRAELRTGFRAATKVKAGAPNIRKRRSKTRAERKAMSLKMKQIWAAKKLQVAKGGSR